MLGKSTKETKARPDLSAPTKPADRGISLISRDTTIRGDCVTEGRLRIQGKISGNVTATGLELESTGTVEGDVAAPEGVQTKDPFIIDGSVEGAVRATVVEVRQNGAVSGGVIADSAVIHGRVQGGILARKSLALEETAAVEGDVRARRLALKEGGQVNGTIRMGERATADDAGGDAFATVAKEPVGSPGVLAGATAGGRADPDDGRGDGG